MRFCLLLFLLLLPISYGALEITEIMSAPSDGNEWIEVYYSGEELFNITGLEITDNYKTNKIICCNETPDCKYFIENNSFFLITAQNSTLNLTQNIYCTDSTVIGNHLNNNYDTLLLSKENITLANATYNLTAKTGFSLSILNGTWQITEPSPLSFYIPRNKTYDLSISVDLPDKVYPKVDYHLFKVKNPDYSEYKERINTSLVYNLSKNEELIANFNLTIFLNVSATAGTVRFNESGEYLICGYIEINDDNPENNHLCRQVFVLNPYDVSCNIALSIETEKQIYENQEKIGFGLVLDNHTFPFEIEYWIESLSGMIEKEKVLTKTTSNRSFTPDSDEEKAYLIKANISFLACNNSNKFISAEKLIVAKGANISNESSIKIIKKPEEASFGESFDLRLKVYKGATRKTAVSIYAKGDEKISYVSSLNLHDNNKEYEITVPIQLKPNCNREYPDGAYDLIIEGLDQKEEAVISVTGIKTSLCIIKTETAASGKKTDKNLPVNAPITLSVSKKLYELVAYKEENSTNELFVFVKINNPDTLMHNYKLWSYLYQGKKSYPSNREENILTLDLKNISSSLAVLRINISNLYGEYNLKVNILRDDRKTPYDITEKILVDGTAQYHKEMIPATEVISQKISDETLESNTTNISSAKMQDITGDVVYLSPSEKLKNYSWLFVLIVIILGIIAIIKLRK